MAVSYTTTYNLTKPEVGASEDEWGGLLNTNFDNLDNLLDGTTPITGIDINSGSIDGTVIGANSAAAITGTTITGTSFVSSGDMTFGDSDKAIFGAGSDLQIYHDGSNSIISDVGTGNLQIRSGGEAMFLNADGSEYIARFNDDSDVKLYYDNAIKLATTSTGINVTGTVTADGLTVDGDGTTNVISAGGANDVLAIKSTDNTASLSLVDTAGSVKILTQSDGRLRFYRDGDANSITGANSKLALSLEANGDISFYEDTGTTAKFFWDASAESLGIGTSSPEGQLHIYSSSVGAPSADADDFVIEKTGDTGLSILSTTTGRIYFGDAASNDQGSIRYVHADNSMRFETDSSERLRIDSSGRVGIGTSSPSSPFVVNTSFNTGYLAQFVNTGTGSDANGVLIKGGVDASDYILRLQDQAGAEVLAAKASGNVGIGESSVDSKFHVKDSLASTGVGSSSSPIAIIQNERTNTGTSSSVLRFDTNEITGTNQYARAAIGAEYDGSSNVNGRLMFSTADTSGNLQEAMRIDSSGNLHVGKTSLDFNAVGVTAQPAGVFAATRDGGTPVIVNRKTSDGELVQLQKDGSAVGSIGSHAGIYTYIGTGNAGLNFAGNISSVMPYNVTSNAYSDNAIDLGTSSARFDDIYATNGTIQTSDRNEKQDIEALSDAEQRVAVACKGLLRKFRWIDAVAEKGDDARIHFGIIAQDLQDAFAAEGLDAGRYAMFISTTWWEATETYTDDDGVEQTRVNTYETLEEAPEGATERTRLGVRYPELLAFIIAAI